MTQTRKWAWDRQWRGNLLSTCCNHSDPATGHAIIRGWEVFFAALPAGAKILDIGTGNGFVALIAAGVSMKENKAFDIHGADYAAIDPLKALQDQAAAFRGVTFHPGTATENLPFEGQSFDAVTAQHALEYGDLEKSLGEIARVLKQGGGSRFLIHAAGGEIVSANLPKIAQCQYLLEDARLFEIAERAVLEALGGQGDDGAALKAALEAASAKFKTDANTRDLMELLELLWGAYEARENFPDVAAFKTWIVENKAETEAQKLRIEAMAAAALTRAGAEGLVSVMQTLGFKDVVLTTSEAPDTNGLIGWLIEGVKGYG